MHMLDVAIFGFQDQLYNELPHMGGTVRGGVAHVEEVALLLALLSRICWLERRS